jgi:hypothetical protein
MNSKQARATLEAEAARFRNLANEHIVKFHHKWTTSAPGSCKIDDDLRLIRDHEIRAETFATAAKLIAQ